MQTRDSPLLPIPNDVARLRKSVISTMRSFTVAPVAFPACTQQAFLLETVFDVLAKINTDAPVNPGHASVLSATLRHSRRLGPDYRCKRRLLGHSTCLLWSNTFRPPANHEQLKWTKDDCGSRIAAYVIFIDKIRGPMNFIYLLRYDYPNSEFFFFQV